MILALQLLIIQVTFKGNFGKVIPLTVLSNFVHY